MPLYKILFIPVLLIIIGFGLWVYIKGTRQELPSIPFINDVPFADKIQFAYLSSTQSNNQFGISLYNELSKETGNVFFSPYSISTAVAMTYEGAKGKTAEEIKNVFGYPSDINKLRNDSLSLYKHLNQSNLEMKLSTANALWAEQTFKLLPSYRSDVQTYYGGNTVNLNFKTDPENSRITINTWVEKQTNDKIKNLLAEKSITADTKLVLTNAIYFKGDWESKFEKDDTDDMKFFISKNNTIKAPTMYQSGDKRDFKYAKTDGIELLEMKYKGNKLSMTILLPQKDQITNLEKKLTTQNIDKWKSELKNSDVYIYLPKFKFNTTYNVKNYLKNMGMNLAFSDTLADFSGMTGEKELYIDSIVHQAFIDVYEEGTEAAGATAVVMAPPAAAFPTKDPTPVFKADHPFIFMINDIETNTVLFIGKIINPIE